MATEMQPAKSKRPRHGLTIVNTGDGKGKTTAALGLILRAWGQGMRVCMIQFLKAKGSRTGEVKAARQLGIEWYNAGGGFTWNFKNEKDEADSIAWAQHGWQLAQEKISSRTYDLIVLDELTYPFHFGWLDINEVIGWLRDNKPQELHLVITGRNAPPELVTYADLVTEMGLVKHPFGQGIKAQVGIEF